MCTNERKIQRADEAQRSIKEEEEEENQEHRRRGRWRGHRRARAEEGQPKKKPQDVTGGMQETEEGSESPETKVTGQECPRGSELPSSEEGLREALAEAQRRKEEAEEMMQ